jgi:hypothetical protein
MDTTAQAGFPIAGTVGILFGGGNMRALYNGANGANGARDNVNASVGTIRIGRSTTTFYDGKCNEWICFDSRLSNADANALGANQASYAGVSWTTIT